MRHSFVRHVLVITVGLVAALPAADHAITVDFGVRADPPLVKKLSLFNSGLVKRAAYERDLGSFGELKADAWRIDLSFGKPDCEMWHDLVGGNVDSGLTYNWTQADWLKARFDEQDILPYWGLSYIPRPLQLRSSWDGWMFVDNANGAFRWDRWRQVGRDFAAHFRAGGRTGYYEVYNEGDLNLSPDHGGDPLRLPVERDGAGNVIEDNPRRQQVMNKLHIEMAKGVREGDPDAVVGGPSYSGHHLWYVGGFCDAVIAAGAPLDFLSYHSIAIPWSTLDEGIFRTQQVREVLRARPQLRTTEMHLNEYFAYSTAARTPENPDGIAGDTNSSDLAMRLIDDLDHFVAMTDVTQLTWAFGMDPYFPPDHPIDSFIGLVATEQAGPVANRRKAFSAFAFYGDIPVQRVASGRVGPIRTLAGLSDDKAAVIIWNTADDTQHVSLTALGIPFRDAVVSTYVVDGNDDPKGLLYAKARSAVTISGPQAWNGNLDGRSVTYVSWTTTPAPTQAPAAQLVRLHRDFPARGTTRYGEFDRRTWTGYVGTGAAPGAGGNLQQVGVTVRGLAPALRVDVTTDGTLPGGGGALGLRVDYQVGSAYTKSVFFHGGAATKVDCPWGTGAQYQDAVTLPNFWNSTINVGAFAPGGWNGQAVLTMVLANAAPNVRARFTLRPGDLSADGVVGGPGTPPPAGGAGGTGTGLLAQYAPAQDFVHPTLTRVDPVVDFAWDHTPPGASLPRTDFCVRWSGQLEVPTSGSYTLITRTDDGVRLWLDGDQLIDDWVGRGATDSSITRTLTGGRRYALRVDYYQGIGGATAQLLWSGPGIPRQVIPRYRLHPASSPDTTPGGIGGGSSGGGSSSNGGSSGGSCGNGAWVAGFLLLATGLWWRRLLSLP